MKLKVLVTVWVLSAVINNVHSQNPDAVPYAQLIAPTDLKNNLNILASDALEGRETGKRGQKMAAAFLRAHYEELGLAGPVNGSYFQPVDLYTSVQGNDYVKVGDIKYKNFEDVVYYGSADSGSEIALPFVFAGKGRSQDIDQIDVKGKGAIVQLGPGDSFRSTIGALTGKGAKMVFYTFEKVEEFKDIASQFKAYMGNGLLSLEKPEIDNSNAGVFFISPEVAERILNTTTAKLNEAIHADPKKNALKKIKAGNASFITAIEIKTLKTENVLGFLEGTDKKDEIVVITSHYDHIGKKDKGQGDLINNGADDDGSGTVTVMQLAKVFAQAKKDGKGPRRSMLFMNVTGEEKGLLGSDYYTQHPVFPLSQTVVDLNIDMVGRRDPQHPDTPYVYVIGADKLSSELHNINEKNNKIYTKLALDYLYNDQSHPERLYYRSDHWNFAKNNIPIIFYFDGIHEDYHQPTDEVEKIDFDLLAKRAQLVFYAAWEIANRDQRLTIDKGK
jgi:hypothetical protein